MHTRRLFLLTLTTGIIFVSTSAYAEETPKKPLPYFIGFPTLSAPVLHAPLLTPMPAVLQSVQRSNGAKPAEVWYGWQSLIGVLACDSLIAISVSVNANSSASSGIVSTLGALGVAGRVFTPPIVHWAHGHVGKGSISLGINVGTPMVVGLIGVGIGWDADIEFGAIVGGMLGLMIGAVGQPSSIRPYCRRSPLLPRLERRIFSTRRTWPSSPCSIPIV